ncbi:MAG: alpha/beta hydrolase [Proteobacteria bacterium]|nr:alpha/beta hydrolase [Burkholderiales bacterium]
MKLSRSKNLRSKNTGLVGAATALAGLATAAWVALRARRAEREHVPLGRFIDVDGVRLHYVDHGEGPPVVLLHGNVVSVDDFQASGLIDRLAGEHRVIAFDRPGFGHSSRPRDRLWTPSAQAALLHRALAQLGVLEPAIVVGHSMGTMVAVAMALDFPSNVRRLVLLGGYYYATARLDAVLTAPVALPVVGDVMRYTVTALSARALLSRAVRKMFAPQPVPAAFYPTLSREMLVRPAQLRANAEDAALMIPAAYASSQRHHELGLPVAILVGEGDKVVDRAAHSLRLHRELSRSMLVEVAGAGHMVHYAAIDSVVAAVRASSANVSGVQPSAAPSAGSSSGSVAPS